MSVTLWKNHQHQKRIIEICDVVAETKGVELGAGTRLYSLIYALPSMKVMKVHLPWQLGYGGTDNKSYHTCGEHRNGSLLWGIAISWDFHLAHMVRVQLKKTGPLVGESWFDAHS